MNIAYNLLLFFISFLLFIVFSGPSYAAYSRIVSLVPSITTSLYELEAADKIVGVSAYCKAENKEIVGTVLEPNVEKIVSLKPDLVLMTSLVDQRLGAKFRSFGIAVKTFKEPKSFDDICRQFLELAELAGRTKKAEEIVTMAKNRVYFIRHGIKALKRPRVFFQIGVKPLYAATGDSFINDFIEFAGGINIAKNSKSGFYSREKVLGDNPDVIVIALMGIMGAQEKQSWARYQALTAVKEKRIYTIDGSMVCEPTPLKFAATLKKMVEILYG